MKEGGTTRGWGKRRVLTSEEQSDAVSRDLQTSGQEAEHSPGDRLHLIRLKGALTQSMIRGHLSQVCARTGLFEGVPRPASCFLLKAESHNDGQRDSKR